MIQRSCVAGQNLAIAEMVPDLIRAPDFFGPQEIGSLRNLDPTKFGPLEVWSLRNLVPL